MYKTKITMEVIKEVYSILKKAGLGFLITGGTIELDLEKISCMIFESNLTNHFCQLVTGDTQTNFDQLAFNDQEEIFLNFFTDIQRLSQDSKIIQAIIKNLIKTETPSLTSASSSDNMEYFLRV